MQRKASAVWNGSLKDGKGSISAPGGVLKNTQYSFKTRFEDAPGTNPEELIAAAHAACFSMALSAGLTRAGTPANELHTSATVTFQPGEGITRSALTVEGRVPGIDQGAFEEAATSAKENCPVSKALAGVPEITLEARLT
jgi:osmotically inducible protein OsmC